MGKSINEHMNGLQLHVQNDISRAGFSFFFHSLHPIAEGNMEGRFQEVIDVTIRNIKPGTVMVPAFTLPREQAQRLMDDMYDAGLRPTHADSPGELSATKAHLADARQQRDMLNDPFVQSIKALLNTKEHEDD